MPMRKPRNNLRSWIFGLIAVIAVLALVGLVLAWNHGDPEDSSESSSPAQAKNDDYQPRDWTEVKFTDRYHGQPMDPTEGALVYTDQRLLVQGINEDGIISVDSDRGYVSGIVLEAVVLPDLPDQSASCREKALTAVEKMIVGREVFVDAKGGATIYVPYTTPVAEVWTIDGQGRADMLVNAELVRQGLAKADPEYPKQAPWRYIAQVERDAALDPCWTQ